MDSEARKEIKRVEEVLEDIRENTTGHWWRQAFNGALYGAGAVVGSVLAIAALGWLLSIFGIIPGFAEIAGYLQTIMQHKF